MINTYSISAGKKPSGRQNREDTLRINALEFEEIDITKVKGPKEVTVVLDERSLLFDFDKYVVKDKIKPSLSTLAKALGENKDIHIKIDGYTDFIGTEAYNLDLSVKRARAIKDFLISKGAIGSNISIEGYGEQNPADTNQTAAGRSRNRRVEFIISRG